MTVPSLNSIPSFVYKILLVVVTAIWGYSFVVMKEVVDVLPPAWLLGVRFGEKLYEVTHPALDNSYNDGEAAA